MLKELALLPDNEASERVSRNAGKLPVAAFECVKNKTEGCINHQ